MLATDMAECKSETAITKRKEMNSTLLRIGKRIMTTPAMMQMMITTEHIVDGIRNKIAGPTS